MHRSHLLLLTLLLLACGAQEPGALGHARSTLIADIIVDDDDPEATTVSGSFGDATGAYEHWDGMSVYSTTGGTVDTMRFTPTLPGADTYEVLAWNSCFHNRATDVPHHIYDGVSNTTVVDVDQDCDTGSHGEWFSLGFYSLSPGAYVEITDAGITSSSPYFGADAIRFVGSTTTGAGGAASGGTGGAGAGGASSGGGGGAASGGTGGTAAGGAGGSGGAAPNPWGLDLFNGSAVSGYTILNQSMFTHQVNAGALSVTLLSSCNTWPFCAWFEGTEGPAFVKLVDGDFKATTLVRVRRESAPTEVVTGGFQFAGLIARDPNTAQENYLFTGTGYRGSYLSNETKDTTDDLSATSGPALADESTADRLLRLCRVGSTFTMYVREIGDAPWALRNTYTRTLGNDLQVGPVAYTFGSIVDLRASFDFFDLQPVGAGCDQ